MSRLARVGIFALLALWLPATLHCRLEAAGVLGIEDGCRDEHGSPGESSCQDDVCPTVEDAFYKNSGTAISVAGPTERSLANALIALRHLPIDSGATELSPERHAPPSEIAVGWQFIARAAPLSRAPSLNS